MLEKKDCRNLLISASVIMGTLAISTIATGLYLIYQGNISHVHFSAGLASGFFAGGTVAGIGYCATKNIFFKNDNQKKPESDENFYLLSNNR